MELNTSKKKIVQYCTVFCGTSTYEENTEMIVPDQSPDILRIIDGCGSAYIKDKNARAGKVDISGTIKGAVLYAVEDDCEVRKLTVTMPFAYIIDGNGITQDSKILARARLRSLDVRELNPRKVAVQATVEVEVCAYELRETEICDSVNDGEKYGVCTRKRSVGMYYPEFIREKSFTISEDIELSGNATHMREILFDKADICPTDTKVIGNKAILKGNTSIQCVYTMEDGTVESAEYELPFSQIIDIEGMRDEHDLKAELTVSGTELEVSYDAAGETRYITVNVMADACILACLSENTDIIDDVYSTKYELETELSEQEYLSLCENTDKRVAVSETIETGTPIKQVLFVNVSVMPSVRRREENGEVLANDAFITVMYTGEDGGVYSAKRKTCVVCPLALRESHNYSSNVAVRGKTSSVGADNEINVRFFADYDICETEEERVSAVLGINVDEENKRNAENTASISVMRLERDTELWELAKKYATTVEEICEANEISDSRSAPAGRMILVPKSR